MSSNQLVLAISNDNRMIHVGRVGELRPHLQFALGGHLPRSAGTAGATVSAQPPGLEYYSIHGEKLSWNRLLANQRFEELPQAERPQAAANRQALRQRINQGLASLQLALDAHPEWLIMRDGVVVTQVPRPSGTFTEVVTELAELFDVLDANARTNDGNWFHLLMHAAFG